MNPAWPKVVRHFTVSGPPSRVRRFYALKIGIKPNVGAGFKGVPVVLNGETSYVSALVTALSNTRPHPKEAGQFTLSTNDYLMNAIYTDRADKTEVTLVLVFNPVIRDTPSPPAKV